MPEPTPIEAFLAPLARIAARDADLEAHVFWATEGAWSDEPAETLEAEEIAFYTEGLLIEGFSLIWQAIGPAPETGSDSAPDTASDGIETILLFVWQGEAAAPPAFGPVVQSGTWPG